MRPITQHEGKITTSFQLSPQLRAEAEKVATKRGERLATMMRRLVTEAVMREGGCQDQAKCA